MLCVLRQQSGSRLRQQLQLPIHRTFATQFVPPAALQEGRNAPPPPKPKPGSPNFYTGRATYHDQLNTVESAITSTRQALTTLQLLPLPKFARDALPPLQPVWMTQDTLGSALQTRLSTSRYRRFTHLLNQLDDYRRIADSAGCYELAGKVQNILALFERDNKLAVLNRGKRKPVKFDEYGRSYTIGRRKESAARVWVIPVQSSKPLPSPASATSSELAPAPTLTQSEATADLTPSEPISLTTKPAEPVTVTATNIIINNAPLSQYFPLQSDRERIVRPFKISGLTGAYNVFAIVRGGGTTGQSGAVSLGIAKALAAHVPEIEALLRRAKLMRRDPRMVERKKTGRPGARAAYTWVKR